MTEQLLRKDPARLRQCARRARDSAIELIALKRAGTITPLEQQLLTKAVTRFTQITAVLLVMDHVAAKLLLISEAARNSGKTQGR